METLLESSYVDDSVFNTEIGAYTHDLMSGKRSLKEKFGNSNFTHIVNKLAELSVKLQAQKMKKMSISD